MKSVFLLLIPHISWQKGCLPNWAEAPNLHQEVYALHMASWQVDTHEYPQGTFGSFWISSIQSGAAGHPKTLFLALLLNRPVASSTLLLPYDPWCFCVAVAFNIFLIWSRTHVPFGISQLKVFCIISLLWQMATLQSLSSFPFGSSSFAFSCWELSLIPLGWWMRKQEKNLFFQIVSTFCNISLSHLDRGGGSNFFLTFEINAGSFSLFVL